MNIENWVDIIGYEGLYQVSDLGRVKRLKGENCKQDRILSQVEGGKGYLKVCLYKKGKKKFYWVHRLVAINFLGDRSAEKLEIDHLDWDKHNNALYNLRWITHRENCSRNFRRRNLNYSRIIIIC